MMTPERRLTETVEAVLVAAALALTFKGFVFQIFHVPSSSMEDTVLAGDYVLVNKFAYGPHRGPWARILPYRDLAREVAIRQDARPRTAVRSVRELVHEHVVAREDRVLHRGAWHVEDLEDEALERERERGGHENGLDRLCEAPFGSHHSTFRTARKASWGSSTRPTFFMRRLPSFCFSRSFFLRVMSPP